MKSLIKYYCCYTYFFLLSARDVLLLTLHTSRITASQSYLISPPGSILCMFFVASDSRAQRGDETKAHSFSGPVVLVFEASQHSVPHVLQRQHTQKQHARVYMFIYGCNNKHYRTGNRTQTVIANANIPIVGLIKNNLI